MFKLAKRSDIQNRRAKVKECWERGDVNKQELARALGVSNDTIRRDLEVIYDNDLSKIESPLPLPHTTRLYGDTYPNHPTTLYKWCNSAVTLNKYGGIALSGSDDTGVVPDDMRGMLLDITHIISTPQDQRRPPTLDIGKQLTIVGRGCKGCGYALKNWGCYFFHFPSKAPGRRGALKKAMQLPCALYDNTQGVVARAEVFRADLIDSGEVSGSKDDSTTPYKDNSYKAVANYILTDKCSVDNV